MKRQRESQDGTPQQGPQDQQEDKRKISSVVQIWADWRCADLSGLAFSDTTRHPVTIFPKLPAEVERHLTRFLGLKDILTSIGRVSTAWHKGSLDAFSGMQTVHLRVLPDRAFCFGRLPFLEQLEIAIPRLSKTWGMRGLETLGGVLVAVSKGSQGLKSLKITVPGPFNEMCEDLEAAIEAMVPFPRLEVLEQEVPDCDFNFVLGPSLRKVKGRTYWVSPDLITNLSRCTKVTSMRIRQDGEYSDGEYDDCRLELVLKAIRFAWAQLVDLHLPGHDYLADNRVLQCILDHCPLMKSLDLSGIERGAGNLHHHDHHPFKFDTVLVEELRGRGCEIII